MLRDRDVKFYRAFDNISPSLGGHRGGADSHPGPSANAFAERWVGMGRAEGLDWLLIVGRRHLQQVLHLYVEHNDGHRARRALRLASLDQPAGVDAFHEAHSGQVHRRDLFGGLLHEYRRAA